MGLKGLHNSARILPAKAHSAFASNSCSFIMEAVISSLSAQLWQNLITNIA